MQIFNVTIKLLLFFIIIPMSMYSRKYSVKKIGMEVFKDKHFLNKHSWFKIVPLQEILQKNPQIMYRKITDKVYFNYTKFSIAPKFPHAGYFHELFTLHIPQGRVQGERGYVFVDGKLSDEMARGDRFECLYNTPQIKDENIQKISGRVAVIAQHGGDKLFVNYYHWMLEVLGRLAMLEMAGIEYDWLYVGHSKKFMKETLVLWGIDFSKIIEPTDDNFCIQADELIVPSMVINTNVGYAYQGNFIHPEVVTYVKNKLLSKAQGDLQNRTIFSDKVFISRHDSVRRFLNEYELFEKLKHFGFESYELSNMSVVDQMRLFNQAKIIVTEHGANLTDILFCRPGTRVIEIFQKLIDNSFWYLSQILQLQYIPILTIPVDTDYFAHWRNQNFTPYMISGTSQVELSQEHIEKILKSVESCL